MEQLRPFKLILALSGAGLLMAQTALSNSEFPIVEDLTKATPSHKARFAPQVKVPIKVRLNGQAEVKHPRIFLESIASCERQSLTCEEILGVDLGQSPKPGGHKTLTRQTVEYILGEEFPHHRIEVEGAERIKIKSQFMEISAETVKNAFRDAMEASLGEVNDLRITVEKLSMPRSIRLWPGDYRISFPLVENAHVLHLDWLLENYTGSQTIVVDCYEVGSDHKLASARAQVRLALEKQLPVSKRHLPRGTILKHEFFEYKWQKIGRSDYKLIDEIKHLVGLRLKQPIRAGNALSSRQVEVPTMIKRGQNVKLVVKKGGLTIVGRARAMDAGGIGETIKVYYPQSKKNIFAEVKNPSTVEVVF